MREAILDGDLDPPCCNFSPGSIFWKHYGGQLRVLPAAVAGVHHWLPDRTVAESTICSCPSLSFAASAPVEFQHNVLFWGILGALVMVRRLHRGRRLLLNRFPPSSTGTGAILIYSGIELFAVKGKEINRKNIMAVSIASCLPLRPRNTR